MIINILLVCLNTSCGQNIGTLDVSNGKWLNQPLTTTNQCIYLKGLHYIVYDFFNETFNSDNRRMEQTRIYVWSTRCRD